MRININRRIPVNFIVQKKLICKNLRKFLSYTNIDKMNLNIIAIFEIYTVEPRDMKHSFAPELVPASR